MNRELAQKQAGPTDGSAPDLAPDLVAVLRSDRDKCAWQSGLTEVPKDVRDPRRPPPRAGGRMHVVLVPGFGGFDALGQVAYYAGVSQVAARWRAAGGEPGRQAVAIHYFDNLPTAGVRTRAERLLHFLLKRVERNEFQDGDQIALVGHSTGGLDIRCLLLDLEQTIARLASREPVSPTAPLPERPPLIESVAVAERLRSMISRVVFLSVPQRGTNIADWTRSLNVVRIPAIAFVAALVDLSDFWLCQSVDLAGAWLARRLHGLVGPDRLPGLVSAMVDVWTENAERRSADPARAADGREALAELTLFLSHTNGDFIAIDDLAVQAQRGGLLAPLRALWGAVRPNLRRSETNDVTHLTRASKEARTLERQMWCNNGIEVLSFATLGTPGVAADECADESQIRSIWPLRGLVGSAKLARTDAPYRIAYAACRSGPLCEVLADPASRGEPDERGEGTLFASPTGETTTLAVWENDGIVNTRSMLWPNGVDTRIVAGDHGDIIGHFRLEIDPRGESARTHGDKARRPGRKYWRYDIFASDSGFDAARFTKVWEEVLSFCATALAPVAIASAGANGAGKVS